MLHVIGGNSYRGRKAFLVAGFVYPCPALKAIVFLDMGKIYWWILGVFGVFMLVLVVSSWNQAKTVQSGAIDALNAQLVQNQKDVEELNMKYCGKKTECSENDIIVFKIKNSQ